MRTGKYQVENSHAHPSQWKNTLREIKADKMLPLETRNHMQAEEGEVYT